MAAAGALEKSTTCRCRILSSPWIFRTRPSRSLESVKSLLDAGRALAGTWRGWGVQLRSSWEGLGGFWTELEEVMRNLKSTSGCPDGRRRSGNARRTTSRTISQAAGWHTSARAHVHSQDPGFLRPGESGQAACIPPQDSRSTAQVSVSPVFSLLLCSGSIHLAMPSRALRIRPTSGAHFGTTKTMGPNPPLAGYVLVPPPSWLPLHFLPVPPRRCGCILSAGTPALPMTIFSSWPASPVRLRFFPPTLSSHPLHHQYS